MRSLAVLCAAAMLAASVTHARTTIKVAIELPESSLMYQMFVHMKARLETRVPATDLEFQIFANGQLGKDQAILNGLRQGTHHMGAHCSTYGAIEPGMAVFEAPFIFANRDHVRKAIYGPVGQALLRRADSKGLVGLAIGELGFRHISNNTRPIVTPADLKGLKIRVPNSPFRAEMFQAYGASTAPIAFGELYMALRQGVVDGQENPLASVFSNKLQEVQKFVSISNHVFTPCFILASKAVFSTWPAPLQEAVRAAAREAGEFSLKRGAEMDNELIRELGKTSAVNQVDVAAFKAASKPIYDQIAKAAGADLMAMMLEAVR